MISRDELIDKLQSVLNIDFTFPDHVYTSSYIAALYAKQFHPDKKKVYALGIKTLADELRGVGFEVLSSQDQNQHHNIGYYNAKDVPFDEDIDMLI